MVQETSCVRLIDDGGDEINNNPEHPKGDKAPDFTKNVLDIRIRSPTLIFQDKKLFTGVNISE